MKTNVDNNDVEITPSLHSNAEEMGFDDVVLLDIQVVFDTRGPPLFTTLTENHFEQNVFSVILDGCEKAIEFIIMMCK